MDTPIILTTDLDKTQFRAEYQDTLAQLDQIINATTPTNAQVIAAIKFLARTVRLILRFLARSYN